MVAAIVDQRLERQLQRAARAHVVVTDVRGVRPVPHPNPPFEQSVGESKRPDRRRAFESKPLEVQVAARGDGAVRPAIGREWKRLGVVFGGLFQFCDQQRAAEWRLKRGDQQAVVAARQRPGDRARGKTAEPVHDQPFALLGGLEIAANLAAEVNEGVNHGKQLSVFSSQLAISYPLLLRIAKYSDTSSL